MKKEADLDQEYTRKLTVWQHHVIRRYTRLFVKEHVDIVALCQAKEVIQKIVERERSLTKRISGQQKIAHYLGISQPNYEQVVKASSTSNGKEAIHQELADLPPPLLIGDPPLAITSATEEDGWSANYNLPIEE